MVGAFLLYVHLRYTKIVGRIFEEKPLFLPLRMTPIQDCENVKFSTRDGLTLAGTYFKTTAPRRLGIVVFSHEFLGDRWSCLAYAGHLRAAGFDLFSFDFRNHGQSDSEPNYNPLQWVSNHELFDLRGALAYLRTRPDYDPAGVGLFGVSRGGGSAICVAAKDPGVWGVVTDGAFGTRSTMLAYIIRWAEIYVQAKSIWAAMPHFVFEFLSWAARKRSQVRLHCRFPSVERGIARIAPRPLFMIHGEKDAYIGPKIAEGLFALAGNPKELWLVPKAKHNRCRENAGPVYYERVAEFFLRNAPRASSSKTSTPVAASEESEPVVGVDQPAAVPTIAPVVPMTIAGNALSPG